MGRLTLEGHEDIKIHTLYGPISRDADSATTTTAINRSATNSGSLIFLFTVGAVADSTTLTPSFTECDTLGGSYTAVANSDLSATPTAFATANDNTHQAIAYKGTKPFVKAVLTQAAHAAALVSIHAIEMRGNLPMGAEGLVAAT